MSVSAGTTVSGTPDLFAAKLAAAVARHVGKPGTIADLKRLTGGATKETWLFSARISEESVRLVLQLSTPRVQLSLDDALAALPRVVGRDDAALMMAAAAEGVPAPPVRAVLAPEDGLGAGYIMDFVPGETIARRILREAQFAPLRARFAEECAAALAGIHRLDAAALPFLQPCGAAEQIALYRRVYDALGHPQAVIELGLHWAERHQPRARRAAVVHGDFRLGNLICGADRIAAVIDWELAIIGDPVQDLGWLCVKTWRFGGPQPVGGISTRGALLDAYDRAGGIAVDRDALRFWEAFGSIKWAIMCLMKGLEHRRTGKRSLEQLAIGRRMEEPLYDFLELLEGRD
jgi:aminoglycoside phosphotransferase (APT) family kinase protein